MKPFILLSIILAFALKPVAQIAVHEQEPDLRILLDSLRAARTDEAKASWNDQFRTLLKTTLENPDAFTYPFQQLQTLGKIDSPDGKVRIFTWNVEQADQSQYYSGFVLRKEDNKPGHKVFELVDNGDMSMSKTDEVLESDNWYGALYYKIIPVEKSNKTYYTVLAWDGHSTMTNIKLIDVLYFSGNSMKLGYPLFKSGTVTKRRVYFEHSEKSVMSLRWDEDQKRIMFDHLSPETPALEGFYEYYVPDMSLDAYEFQGNKWVLLEDVIGVNKGNEQVHMNRLNEKTGETEVVVVDNKWIDPTTEGSPASKEVHIAMTPELATGTSDKPDKTDKDIKKDPNNALDAYNNKKRHKKDKEPVSPYSGSGKKPKKKR